MLDVPYRRYQASTHETLSGAPDFMLSRFRKGCTDHLQREAAQ